MLRATGKNLGFADYLKAAFRWQPRVPGLGRMPLHPLALAGFGVLGLANPGFWLLGLAAELTYLFSLASSKRFQKLVRGQHLAANQQSWEERMQRTLDQLGTEGRNRYHRLLAECRHIVGISEALGQAPKWLTLEGHRAGGLNQLLWIFLRLLASRRVLEDNLSRVDREELEGEIAGLEKRITHEETARGDSAAESALLRSLRGTLDIQRQRLDNLEKARESRQVIDAELARIEQQVVLMREETAVRGKAEQLSSRLETVTGTLRETNRWMEQNAEIFGELGADPLGDAPPELPSMAELAEEEGS